MQWSLDSRQLCKPPDEVTKFASKGFAKFASHNFIVLGNFTITILVLISK